MSSIFSQIIKGSIHAYKIKENEHFLAFLDIAPLRPGHTLVIPKIEEEYFFNLPDHTLQEILLFAKPIAKAIEQVCHCNRCAMSVVGLEVPHAHIHLVPISSMTDINFSSVRTQPTKEALTTIQHRLINCLSSK